MTRRDCTQPAEMSDAELRVKVAELCGWRRTNDTVKSAKDPRRKMWVNRMKGLFGHLDDLPDYCHDLNAIAEAEKMLRPYQSDLYACLIVKALDPPRIDGYDPEKDGAPTLAWCGVFRVIQATARQRCEAFVETVSRCQ